MNPDRPSLPPVEASREPDLDNNLVATRILESGTDEELARLKAHAEKRANAAMSTEQFDLYRSFAQQRRRLIDKSDREVAERIANNPEATDLERRVGIYKEQLETPVREAVFTLRERGYSSFESGFQGLEQQNISFDAPIAELATFALPEDTRAAFEQAAAEPYIREKAIGYRMRRALPDTKLTELWQLLVRDLPTLAEPQPLTTVQTAVLFREKHSR